MRINLNNLFLALCFVSMVSSSWAQSDTTKTQGEIISGEIVIEKDKKITLPKADKIYLRSPVQELDPGTINLSFDIKEPAMDWPAYKSDVSFREVQELQANPKYQNYVRFGYGNYKSWLLEGGFYQTLGNWNTTTHLFYENFGKGPVDKENSGNGSGGMRFLASYQTEKFTADPSITFSNQRYRFYGNTDRINSGIGNLVSPEANVNEFKIESPLNFTWDKLDLEVIPIITTLSQRINLGNDENSETSFQAKSALRYSIDKNLSAGVDLHASQAKYDGGLSYTRSLINVTPSVIHTTENLSINAGLLISSSTRNSISKTGLYPKIKVDMGISDTWTVYGLLDGGQNWVSLSDAFRENEFLDDSLVLINTETEYQFGGGLKGNPIKSVFIDAFLTYSSLNGLPFYTPSITDSTKFTLTYDAEQVGLTRLNVDLVFTPTTISTYGAKIELNAYATESLDKPWHKPSYVFKGYTSHNVSEKLIVSSFLTAMGGVRAPARVDFGYTTLTPFLDLGFGAKYLFTDRASAFIDVNNLLNKEYERYLGYPTRGLSFKLGAQYRF